LVLAGGEVRITVFRGNPPFRGEKKREVSGKEKGRN